MLSGLDAVDWAALDYAYGPAADLPEMIRAAASIDEEKAESAVDELFSSVFHQGTVYSASVAVVPFVAELTIRPAVHHRFLLVYLLGGMADPQEADGLAVDAVKAALTGQVPRLLPLLADPDLRVRETAAYTLAQCPEAAGPIAAWLRERWGVEEVPLVRASLLAAGSRLDPGGWADLLVQALGDPHPAVRAAAALARVWAELPWPSGATEAVISAYGEGDPLTSWVWTGGDDSLPRLLERFDDVSGIPTQVLGALVRSPQEDVRGLAVYVIEVLNHARRSAPAKLVPLLAPLLADADEAVRRAAVRTVRTAGSAGAMVANELALLAARCPYGDESDGWESAAEALCALIQLGDPRWRAPLLAAFRSGWAPFDAGSVLSRAGVAPDPELLAAVRRRLASIQGALGPADLESARYIPEPGLPTLVYNERASLVWLLRSWGAAAAPAVLELIVALERGWGAAARALTAIGPAATPALPALRVAARQGDVDAATAVWQLAGDPAPLISAVEQAIRFDTFHAPAIEQLLQLGEHARQLLPQLRRLLTGKAARTFPQRDAQIAAARVAWGLGANPAEVMPTVQAVLAAGDQPAGAAARLAGELGTHARRLLPLLRAALHDRWARVHAARALWLLEGDTSELVDPLLESAAEDYGGGEVAVDLLVEMRATHAVPRLRQMAEQDARIVCAGIMDEIVAHDEQLQTRLRQAIQQLQG